MTALYHCWLYCVKMSQLSRRKSPGSFVKEAHTHQKESIVRRFTETTGVRVEVNATNPQVLISIDDGKTDEIGNLSPAS